MKRFSLLVIVLTLTTCLSACSSAERKVGSTDPKLNLAQEETTKTGQGQDTGPAEIEVLKTIINPTNIFSSTEKVKVDRWVFSDVSVAHRSNTLPEGVSKKDVRYFYEEVNEQGKLLNGEKYVWLDISVQNSSSKEEELYVSSLKFLSLMDNNEIADQSDELRFFKPAQHNINNKSYYSVRFKPNETKRFTLLYILDKEQITRTNWYFLVDWTDHNDGYENYKVYKVNTKDAGN